ncbi:MAG: hypothetical protein IT381_13255 [Deltaproteobacteria bacterium]|nr:hypothetical protein [Deltaproteobacteria bacterium]
MKTLSLLAAAALVFAACGATPCQKASDSLKRFATKASKCASGVTLRTLDVTSCDRQIGTCSTADVAKLDTYAKCLDAVAECDPAAPMGFKSAGDACDATAESFKISCAAGL